MILVDTTVWVVGWMTLCAFNSCQAGARAPTLTPSMRIALADLALDALYVVYPGNRRYVLADRIEAVPLAAFVGTP